MTVRKRKPAELKTAGWKMSTLTTGPWVRNTIVVNPWREPVFRGTGLQCIAYLRVVRPGGDHDDAVDAALEFQPTVRCAHIPTLRAGQVFADSACTADVEAGTSDWCDDHRPLHPPRDGVVEGRDGITRPVEPVDPWAYSEHERTS